MFERFRQLIEQASQGLALSQDPAHPNLLRIGHALVLPGELPALPERDAVLAQVDAWLALVLAQRKQMNAAAATDIYMMLLAPPGSRSHGAWLALASEIERDDRLARKHVWLPDAQGNNFAEFIAATFLARPWQTPAGNSDALALLNQENGLPPAWRSVLSNPELEGVELVQALFRLQHLEAQVSP